MKKILSVAIVAIMVLSSCGHTLEPSEVRKNVLDFDEGLFAGISIGDSWEDVKKEKADYWDVREDTGFGEGSPDIIQLRKEWDGPSDMMYIGFMLDDNKKITRIEFDLHANGSNITTGQLLYKEFASNLSIRYDKLSAGEYPTWNVGQNGEGVVLTGSEVVEDDYMFFNFYTPYPSN